ncbi:MAG TPA: class I SAM-dependent methyltransferase, partial [Methanoregula sp.]|nr:class I SAM-dependent methyltransferase [Methanoregula sp.]
MSCLGRERRRGSKGSFPLPKNAQVLDIGCGTGAQTRDLAELTSGTITAVDNYQPFLDTVTARAQKNGIVERIRTVNASMDALPFKKGQFDLI